MTADGAALGEAERIVWLRLVRSEGIGPRTFRGLIGRFGSAAAALEALPRLHRERGVALHVTTLEEARAELAAAERLGVTYVALGEAAYPKALAATPDSPPLIGVRGDPATLLRPAVAIVGSRNASALGLRFTEALSRELGEAGFVVVSGLARGIDAKAHAAAVPTGTIAVLAGGHQHIYPPENAPLLEQLLQDGAAVSEMPITLRPQGRDFPRRNRIVSGLALGVVVIEAARGSGSLITARFAAEQGREVFAVPGSPLDPRAEGTNALIRDGATLITSAEQVIETLKPMIAAARGAPEPGLAEGEGGGGEPLWDELEPYAVQAPVPSAEASAGWAVEGEAASPTPRNGAAADSAAERVLAVLGAAPAPLDDVVRGCGLPAGAVRAALLELEIAGRIQRMSGDLVALAG